MASSVLRMSQCWWCVVLMVVVVAVSSSHACHIRNCPRGGKRGMEILETARRLVSSSVYPCRFRRCGKRGMESLETAKRGAGNDARKILRYGREVEDIIGLDKTKLDEACKMLDTPPVQGIDIKVLEQIFKDVDGSVSGGEKDGVLDEGEIIVFIDTLDVLAYCAKKAETS